MSVMLRNARRGAIFDSVALDSVRDLHAPLLMMHQDGDPAIPAEQTVHYSAAARAAGVSVEVHIYEGKLNTLENAPTTTREDRTLAPTRLARKK